MKYNKIILLSGICICLAIFYTACKKEYSEPKNQVTNHLKSTQQDSLLCVNIENFLYSIENKKSYQLVFDSARFYLEASVNYHYGRMNAFGNSLVDSFSVSRTC